MADKRTINITVGLAEGYRTLMSETLTLPAETDITRVGMLIERKVAGLVETVNDFYPVEAEEASPIESTTNLT